MYELPANRNQPDLTRAGGPLAPSQYSPAPAGYAYRIREDGFFWRRMSRTTQKHWRLIAGIVAASLVLLAIIVFSMRNTYEATARIEILPPPGPEAVSLKDEGAPPPSDQQDYFQTQLEILQGKDLAFAVIQKLRLDQNPEIASDPNSHSWFDTAKSWVGLGGDPSTAASLDQTAKNFEGHLSITQVHNSQLVEVSFASHNPQLAEQVTNALLDMYLQKTRRSQYEATMAAASALSGELNALKTDVDKANTALVAFQRENNIVDTGNFVPAGSDVAAGAQNPVSERVLELNQELTRAEADRLNQESYLRMIYSGNTASLPQMQGSVVLQELQKQLAETRAQLAQNLAVYGENNERVRELHDEADELRAQVDAERQRITNQITTSYHAAQSHEQLLHNQLAGMQDNLDRADQAMVQYALLKQQAEAKSNLYVTMKSRLNEIALSSSLFSNNIRVLDHARLPGTPARPKRMEILMVGFLFSLIAGMAIALVRENFDDTVNTMDDVREWTGLPCLGIVPRIGSGSAVALGGMDARQLLAKHPPKALSRGPRSRFFIDRPGSPEAEAMHSLDTSIRLPVRTEAEPRKVLVIASSFPSEGKTTIAMNLAMALSRHGPTCLVDADMRNPQVGRAFALSTQKGLRDLLAGSAKLEEVLHPAPRLDKLMILPAGSTPPDPVELLASARMRDAMAQLRNKFTYVVMDSPPVVPYADSRWLACLADGVVLVARAGATTRQALGLSSEILKELRAPVLGVVLNGVDLKTEYYWYGYGYPERRKIA